MSETAKTLCERVRALARTEQLQLVDEILGSPDETDPTIDRLWAREAEDRLVAWRRGEIRDVPLDDVLRKYRRG